MVSDPSTQSPLVLAVFFSHREFSSAQDDDTRGADGFLSGRYIACFGTSGVILRYE